MSRHEVVVIGGGPGGCALATLVAGAGRDVALLEKRSFPRFQIGESLVPACNLTLEKIGVLDKMDAWHFPQKHAVQFFMPGGPTRPFYFSEVKDPRMHQTWQVLRSSFDEKLLENAEQHGVTASTDSEVVGICQDGARVTGVRVKRADGSEETIEATVVVDAAGQNGPLAKRLGGREHIPGLENVAIYAHYENAVFDDGIDAGSTLIFRLDSMSWLWFIPLPDRRVSIGLVTPAREIVRESGSSAEILNRAIARSEPLAKRLADARRTTDVRAARDYSYRATTDGGPGWLLVGDALAFIDPIYSTGLFLAMYSAELAADAILDRLSRQNGVPDFAEYSPEYRTAFEQLLVLVRAYYRDDVHFGELAKNPSHRQGLVDLLTGVVGTAEANDVTRALQASMGDKLVL